MPHPSPSSSPGFVSHRTVFYLSGFDPKGASHYHALYRGEAEKQSRLSGIQISVGRREKAASGNSTWKVTAEIPEGTVETHYEFMKWDDIVRKNWPRNQFQLIWDILTTTWLNLRHGTLWRILKIGWPPFVALFAPFLLVCTALLGAPFLALTLFSFAMPSLGPWIATALALMAIALIAHVGQHLENKFCMSWLMRSYAFTARQCQGNSPELEARLDQHARTLLARISLAADDEILLVGHSSGSMMATSVLAKAVRLNPMIGQGRPVISLLTLGQCMPLLGCLPKAQAYRDDLRLLATVPGIHWVDFSAPSDGCCFALADPISACGINTSDRHENRPKLLSPRFAEMFEPADYDVIRRDKLRIHFQYLMAGNKLANYDYFAVTAGTTTLGDRFSASQSINNFTKFKLFIFRK